MLKKTLISLVACVALVGIAAAVYSVTGGDDPEPAAPDTRASTVQDAWDGAADRPINTTFVRSGQSITVQSAAFEKLHTAEASAVVTVAVPARQGKLPSWVTKSAFTARSTDALTFRPAVTARRDGQFFFVDVTFRRLPTGHLGPTCDSPTPPENTIDMWINGPDGRFAVGLVAPQPPAGACLASEPARAPVPKRARRKAGSRQKKAKADRKQKSRKARGR